MFLRCLFVILLTNTLRNRLKQKPRQTISVVCCFYWLLYRWRKWVGVISRIRCRGRAGLVILLKNNCSGQLKLGLFWCDFYKSMALMGNFNEVIYTVHLGRKNTLSLFTKCALCKELLIDKSSNNVGTKCCNHFWINHNSL